MEKDTLLWPRPLAGKSTKDLIVMLKAAACGRLDTACHSEFYCRFRNRFYNICHVVCTRRKLENLAEDVCTDAFISTLQSIGNFEFDNAAANEAVERKLLAFMGTIAARRLFDHLRVTVKESMAEQDTAREEAFDEDQFDDLELVENGSLQQQVLQEALDSLPDVQRYILMVYMDFGALKIDKPVENSGDDPEIGADNVSFRKIASVERKRLCKDLGITESHLRVLKYRAIRKVIKHIKTHT